MDRGGARLHAAPRRCIAGRLSRSSCSRCSRAAFVRWRHRVFFVALLLVGVVIIAVGAHPYDSPTPLGALFKAFATGSTAGLALRSTGRAVPLVVLALAMFLGLGDERAVPSGCGASGKAALALAVPVARRSCSSSSNFPALSTARSTARTCSAPKQSRATGRRRSPRSTPATTRRASSRCRAPTSRRTVGQHGRPDHARPHRPPVRRARADSVRHAGQRRSAERDRPPPAGRRRRSRGLVALGGAWASATCVARNDIQYERYDLVRPTELARVLAQVPGLGTPKSVRPSRRSSPSPGHDDEISLAAPAERRAGRAGRRLSGREPDADRARRSRPSTRLMVSGDGEGLVDAADVGLLDGAGVDPLLGVVSVARRSCAPRPTPATVLVVTDNNRLRARRWSSVTRQPRLHRAGGRGRQAADDRPRRRPPRRVPGEHAERAHDDRRRRREARVARQRTATRSRYTPEDRAGDGVRRRSRRPRGAPQAFGDAMRRSASAIELDARSRPTTSTWCSRSTAAATAGSRKSQLTLRRRRPGRRSTLGPDVRATRRPGQTVHVRRSARSARSRSRVTQTNDQRTNLFGQADAVGFAEIGLRDEHATHDVRVREIEQMPTDLVDALGRGHAPTTRSCSSCAAMPCARCRRARSPSCRSPASSRCRAARTFPFTRATRPSAPMRPARAIATALGVATRARRVDGVVVGLPGRLPRVPARRRHRRRRRTPRGRRRSTTSADNGRSTRCAKPISFDHLDLHVIADGRHSVPTRVHARRRRRSPRARRCRAIIDQRGTERDANGAPRRSRRVIGRDIRLTIDDVRENRALRFATAATVLAAGRHRRARCARASCCRRCRRAARQRVPPRSPRDRRPAGAGAGHRARPARATR